jgi:parallel beta-helix repeat protein
MTGQERLNKEYKEYYRNAGCIFKLIIILSLSVFGCIKASATNYYFSNSTGLDSRNSTEAQNSTTPWQTLSKLQTVWLAGTFAPGDSILFKRGETFYGTIAIGESGTEVLPIVVGAWGTGADPVFTGLVSLSWSNYETNKWRSQALSGVGLIDVVVKDNAPLPFGRYPQGNLLFIDAVTSVGPTAAPDTNTITDAALPALNYTGEIVTYVRNWIISRNEILSTNTSTKVITYIEASNNTPPVGWGYFIQNDPLTLTYQDAWWYNADLNTIEMYSVGAPTNSYASTIFNNVTSSSKSYVNFHNIVFEGANKECISLSGGRMIKFYSCRFRYSGLAGVLSQGNNAMTLIENCYFNDNLDRGFWFGTGQSADSVTIKNSFFSNTGTIPGMGSWGGGGLSAIDLRQASTSAGGYNFIENNQITNSGYCGVYASGKDLYIRNNYINTFCFIVDDGAGVYISDGYNKSYPNRIISGNIILNGIATYLGTPGSAGCHGIYLDQNANNVRCFDNTVAYIVGDAFYLHGGSDILIRNNTFYGNNVQAKVDSDTTNIVSMRRDTLVSNLIFLTDTSTRAFYILTDSITYPNIHLWGKIDSNIYAKPLNRLGNIFQMQIAYPNVIGDPVTYYTFSGWRAAYPAYDVHSSLSTTIFNTLDNLNDSTALVYNYLETPLDIPLTGSWQNVRTGTVSTGTVTLQPHTSAVMVRVEDIIIPSGNTIKSRKRFVF